MAYTAPSPAASGTTFAQFQSGGASGHLELLITAQAATAAPTVAATATANGGGATGGSIPAGKYYFVITESNGFGETTAGPESVQLTVGATNIPRVTFQTLKTGNKSRNIYFSLIGAASGGPYYLYASGITAATYDCAAAAPTNSYAVSPPTINTTGLTYADANGVTINKTLELIRSMKDGNLEDVYRYLHQVIEEFNSGQPSTWNAKMIKFRHAHAVFAMADTLCSEMGTLIDANAGTLGYAATGIGGQKAVRTWP